MQAQSKHPRRWPKRIRGVIFALVFIIIGFVVCGILVESLEDRELRARFAREAGELIFLATKLREGDHNTVIHSLEREANMKLEVSAWDSEIAKLPPHIMMYWQEAKMYYSKYKADASEDSAGSYNVRTRLEHVPWPDHVIAKREFDSRFGDSTQQLAPELHHASIKAWLNSGPVTLQSLNGRVVLLDFWGSECGPCIAAFPKVRELYAAYQDSGLEIIGIVSGVDKGAENIIKEKGLTFPVCSTMGNNLQTKYAVHGIPSYYLIDKTGCLVWGPSHELPSEKQIKQLLGQPDDVLTNRSSVP